MENYTEIQAVPPLDENLKKAVTEMLVLYLLSQREYYIGELMEKMDTASHHALHVVFPYAAVYRMERSEYIEASRKRRAPDGRWRQYYQITDKGRGRLKIQLEMYHRVIQGVTDILNNEDEK